MPLPDHFEAIIGKGERLEITANGIRYANDAVESPVQVGKMRGRIKPADMSHGSAISDDSGWSRHFSARTQGSGKCPVGQAVKNVKRMLFLKPAVQSHGIAVDPVPEVVRNVRNFQVKAHPSRRGSGMGNDKQFNSRLVKRGREL